MSKLGQPSLWSQYFALRLMPCRRCALLAGLALLTALIPGGLAVGVESAPRNIVLIVSDDHRYDFMGCADGPEFLETPNLDRMASQGAHLKNAFVSTSLCSPSRASILTGQYMHRHRVVDNQRPVPKGTQFFPQHLQRAGFATAFVGKWHMGHDSDEAQPGFDHWVSFRGQGEYFNPTLNENGRRKEYQGYTTDILTDQALGWLKTVQTKPFCLCLSYKAVHYPFQPATRYRGRYDSKPIDYPETMANTEENYASQSRWIRDRRYGIHGIDHMETGAFDKDPVPSFDDLYRRYCETVHGLDENVGRVLDFLDEAQLSQDTLVVYLGDNGFALGEHGFYDKRDAFEESIRVPMLAYAPGLIEPGTKIEPLVQNIDLAPTLLAAAGVTAPKSADFDGQSFLPLLAGENPEWRSRIFYEYYWEWNFPATPTLFAVRTDRYKYVFYHGVWDKNGFYDLQTDPHERHNLIDVPSYQEQIGQMREELFTWLQETDGLQIPIMRPAGERLGDRKLPR